MYCTPHTPFCFYHFELKSWLYREWRRRTQWWSTLLCQTQTVVEVWFKWISQIVKYLNWSCFSAVDVAAAAAAVVTPSSERLFEIFRENEYDSSTPEIIYCAALFCNFMSHEMYALSKIRSGHCCPYAG